MFFSSFQPSRYLSGFVDNLWIYEGYEAEHTNERILPSGTIELVINLHEDQLRIYKTDSENESTRYSGAVFSGAYKNGFVSDTEEETCIMGVHFRPGGAFPFLGPPTDEIANAHVDLDQLWGRNGRSLREKLCDATTAEDKFRILQEALIDNLSRPLEHHYAVATALEILERNTDASVREMARAVGLSQRRFIQVFKSEVGMTPKLFSRIVRFQRARKVIEKSRVPDWPALAVECGYFDQSHMIRDFNEFSGTSPETYLRRHEQFVENRVHIKNNHFPCF